MRPRGEVREALSAAAEALAAERAAFTCADLLGAVRLQLGGQVGRRTVANMVAWGELERVGDTRRPGVCKPVALYVPGRAGRTGGGPDLARITQAWVQSY